ncbi:MAG: hypothetical protein HYS86_03165 [Candidatus Chisholmbacteria bacterium]|nr:hypothetical protein [Candidatus Chisholmbacteria bacterium]
MTSNPFNLPNLKPPEPEPNPFDPAQGDLTKAVENSKEILVLIRENPKLDHVASALALFLALKAGGKSVHIASATEMRVEFNRLVGVDKITQSVGNRNLVISFPYVKDSIEKVSYNVTDTTFDLVIQPKSGFPSLDAKKINYSYVGAEADLVFVVGAQRLDDLGALYHTDRKLFESATIVNIDASPTNTKFAPLNLVWNEFSSCAEVVYEIITRLSLTIDQDMATNLLSGLSEATQNFQRFNLKPHAFEVAGKLMAQGAKRTFMPQTAAMGTPGGFASPFGPFPGAAPAPFPSPFQGFTPQAQPMQPLPPVPVQPPAPASPSPTPQLQPEPQTQPTQSPKPVPQPAVNPLNPNNGNGQDVNSNQLQEDWLKPKIFKGSSKV